MKLRHTLPFILIMTLAPAAAMACAACGCTLDTDEAATIDSNNPSSGFKLDERFDYVNQNQLMDGGHAAPDQNPNDFPEVQKKTTTVFYTTTLDYTSQDAWGVSASIPFQYRFHSSNNDGMDDDWYSKTRWLDEMGDARVLGRYTGITANHEFPVMFGLKLPTGSTNERFSSGNPSVTGTQLDRGLQPGTGTTDLLLGLGQGGSLSDKLTWFSQEMWQRPLDNVGGFRPGQTISASTGVRYAIDETFVPVLQINAQNRWRDTGDSPATDRVNSGGELVNLSPGLFVNVNEKLSVYTFVQVPVYQRVGGLELVPDYTASVGVKYKF
jgi:hypothetical protein